MSDDTEETETHSRFSIYGLFQKIPLLIGIAVMLWFMLAQNFPSLVPQPGKLVTPPHHKSRETVAATQQNSNPVAPVPDEAVKTHPDDSHTARPEQPPQAIHSDEADKEHIASLEDKVARLDQELSDIKSQLDERAHNIKKGDEALDEKLEQHEKLMKSMKAQIDSLQDNSADRLTTMKTQIDSLQENNADLLKAMKAQMEALKESSANQLSAITAFFIMKDTALRGEPFDNELKQLAGIIHNPEQTKLLMQLKPFADDGIVTLEALQSQFEKLLPAALSPGHQSDTLSHNLQSLIVIRKEGEDQQGSDDESVLARVEAKINRGEIAGGLKEMQTLSPPVADVMADWIKNAKAYVNGRNALNALHVLLLRDASERPAVAATKPAPALPPLPQPKPAAAPKPAPVATPVPQPKPAEKAPEKPAAEKLPEQAPDLIDDSASEQEPEMAPALDAEPNSTPKPDTVNE